MRPRSSGSYRRACGAWLLAATLGSTLAACGARTIGDWGEWRPDGAAGGGGDGGGGGTGGGMGGAQMWSPSTCAPCDDPLVDCAACYIQGQPEIYRCPPSIGMDCLNLQELHVDENGHHYTCFYCE